MQVIEICSYPKSGNTWLRGLISQCLIENNATGTIGSRGVHKEKKEMLLDIYNRKGANIDKLSEPVYFYKSHIPHHPQIRPDKVIYLYRHPLDVLLSSLNFIYNKSTFNKESIDPRRIRKIFINGIPKSCDEIKKSDEMDFYINRFTKNLGKNLYSDLLKRKSNYFNHVIKTFEKKNVYSIKYEDLFNDTSTTVVRLLNNVLDTQLDNTHISTSIVNKKTKESGKRFYWKAKSGTRFDYLTNEQIKLFESKHKTKLRKIGYL